MSSFAQQAGQLAKAFPLSSCVCRVVLVGMQLHTQQFLAFLLTSVSTTSSSSSSPALADDEAWPPLLFECDADGGGPSLTQGLGDEENSVSVHSFLSHHEKPPCVSSADASRRLAGKTVLRRGFLHQFFPLFESKRRRFAVLKSNCLFLFRPSELPENAWLAEHQERLRKCRSLREVITSFTKDNKGRQRLVSLLHPAREELRHKNADTGKMPLGKGSKDRERTARGGEEEERIGDGVEVLFLENVVVRPIRRRVLDARSPGTSPQRISQL